MKEKQSGANPLIRSFLSSYSKFGTRSLSTSQSCARLTVGAEAKKSFIDFRRVSRQQQQKVANGRLKLGANGDQGKKESRLHKCAIGKHKNLEDREQEQNKYDLLRMVRQLKDTNARLELDNSRLRQQKEEDQNKINTLTQIVRNLEEAIFLARSQPSQSVKLSPIPEKIWREGHAQRISRSASTNFSKESRGQGVGPEAQSLQHLGQSGVASIQKKKMKQLRGAKKSEQKGASMTKMGLLSCSQFQLMVSQLREMQSRELGEIDSLLFASHF